VDCCAEPQERSEQESLRSMVMINQMTRKGWLRTDPIFCIDICSVSEKQLDDRRGVQISVTSKVKGCVLRLMRRTKRERVSE
jgi:hypothetical protein